MKFQFCPNCGGISTMQKQATGLQQCSRCKFIGESKEGTAAEANSLVKRIKYNACDNTNAQGMAKTQNASSMNAIKETALKPEANNKKIDLIVDERLKKMKGKKDGNSEFL